MTPDKLDVPLNLVRPYTCDGVFSSGVVFSSLQIAIQASLEVLGTRVSPTPVVLPVTAAPSAMSAVLRSGAHPFLLDVSVKTLQIDPNQLREVLEEFETVIAVLPIPGGQDIDPALLEMVKDLPTVVDTRCAPTLSPKHLGTFTVYDLTDAVGSGGLVCSRFQAQLQDLLVARSALLGHDAAMSPILAERLVESAESLEQRWSNSRKTYTTYSDALVSKGKKSFVVFENCGEYSPYYPVRVKDASKVVEGLQREGVDAKTLISPLHRIPELAKRWKESPEYPAAESLENRIVVLPTTVHSLYDKDAEWVCGRIIDLTIALND